MSYGNWKRILAVFSFDNSVFNDIFVIKHTWRDPLVRSAAHFDLFFFLSSPLFFLLLGSVSSFFLFFGFFITSNFRSSVLFFSFFFLLLSLGLVFLVFIFFSFFFHWVQAFGFFFFWFFITSNFRSSVLSFFFFFFFFFFHWVRVSWFFFLLLLLLLLSLGLVSLGFLFFFLLLGSVSLGTRKKKKLHRVTGMRPTKNVKNIEWWQVNDGAKQVRYFKMMSDKWRKFCDEKKKHPNMLLLSCGATSLFHFSVFIIILFYLFIFYLFLFIGTRQQTTHVAFIFIYFFLSIC